MQPHSQLAARAESWVAAYEKAWRAPGVESLRELFVEGATYRMSPYEKEIIGLEAIGGLWGRERAGPDEEFEMEHEIVAVDGDTAVIRVEVHYGGPDHLEYRDLWIIRLAEDGRCRSFEEWPFWPGQPLAASPLDPDRPKEET